MNRMTDLWQQKLACDYTPPPVYNRSRERGCERVEAFCLLQIIAVLLMGIHFTCISRRSVDISLTVNSVCGEQILYSTVTSRYI